MCWFRNCRRKYFFLILIFTHFLIVQNSQPIAASALDIFSESSLGSVARVTGGNTVTLDGLTGNYYATVTQQLTRVTQSGTIVDDRLMSTIQQAQLKP